MTRYTLGKILLLSSLAVSSISCGGLLPTPHDPPASSPAPTAQSDATPPAVADASASVTEPDDKKVDAEEVLKNALARAQTEDKSVLVHLGAPW